MFTPMAERKSVLHIPAFSVTARIIMTITETILEVQMTSTAERSDSLIRNLLAESIIYLVSFLIGKRIDSFIVWACMLLCS